MIGRNLVITAIALTLASATAANAKKPPPTPPQPTGPTLGATLCTLSDISAGGAGASLCGGWYTGNLDGGSSAKNDDSAAALNAMLGVSTYTGSNLTFLEDIDVSGSTVDFNTPLYGETIVAFHVGAAKGAHNPSGVGYESTAFYEFDAGDLVGGLDTITFNLAGLSNARLYSTGTYQPPVCTTACGGSQTPGVPEPAAWALMILGFGGAGAMLRRRRAVVA
ncbi:MAG TPA: PEPxxWA-CTERM sorting domain-containing protein [Phenylobacterium sp.]|jgi:hypothetical protein|nr:PEPxxWA-CTERM sorting domain-containing protein [Phenylobacterium sp.]